MTTGPRVARWLVAVGVALAGQLFATVAAAHPFQDGLAGHRLRLSVVPDHVEVDLLVEEPVPWVLRDLRAFLADVADPGPADQARYDARRLEEFQSGLQLFVDGERVAWERLPWTGDNGVGDRQFVVYGLRLRAPLDPASTDQTLHLLDAIHPDQRVARMVEVRGDWQTDLRGCSLWAEPGTDRSGQWALGDGSQELRLTRRVAGPVQATWARLGMWQRGELGAPVPVGPAGVAGPAVGGTAWLGLAGFTVLVGGVGLLWARRRRS